MSLKLKATVTVGKVDISFFDKVILEDVLVEDRKGDSLLFVKEAWTDISHISIEKKEIYLDELRFIEASINLNRDSLGMSNAAFLIETFSVEKKDSLAWGVVINDFRIENSDFTYLDRRGKPERTDVINFKDTEIEGLNFSSENISFEKGIIHFELVDFSFKEKSGFELHDFDADVFVNEKTINLSKLLLKTNQSIIRSYFLDFSYDKISDFEEFISKVQVNSQFEDAILNMNDIAFFTHTLKGFSNEVRFSGELVGTVSDFKAKAFRIWFADSTFFKGSVDFTGLPNVNETFMYLNVEKVYTTAHDLEQIQLLPFYKKNTLVVPKEVKRLGQLFYSGNITGFFYDFVAYGKLKTKVGTLSTDIAIKRDMSLDKILLKGKLKTTGLNIGGVFANDYLANIQFNAIVDGAVNSFNEGEAKVKGNVSAFDFNGYTYKNITVDGLISNSKFNGLCKVDDENVNLEFFGRLDLSDSIPVFDFNASLRGAKLAKLHLVEDSAANLSLNVLAKLYGNKPDNVRGILKLLNFEYSNSNGFFYQPNAELIIKQENGTKDIAWHSQSVDCSLIGEFTFSNLLNHFNNIIHQYLPSFPHVVDDSAVKNNANFKFTLQVKDIGDIVSTFYPDIKISNYSMLSGEYASSRDFLQIQTAIPKISYKTYEFSNVVISGETTDDSFNLETQFDIPIFNKNFKGIKTDISFSHDTVVYNTRWRQIDSVKYDGNLNMRGVFQQGINGTQFTSFLEKGTIMVADSLWNYSNATFLVDSTQFQVHNLNFNKGLEGLFFDGVLTDNEKDTLNIVMKNIKIDNYNRIIGLDNIRMTGELDCEIALQTLTSTPKISSDIYIENLTMNGKEIGLVKANTKWNASKEALEVSFGVEKGRLKIVDLKGDVFLKTMKLDFDLELNNVYLKTYESLLGSILSKVKGYASGKVEIGGTVNKPLFFGEVDIKGGGATINYLNTPYLIAGKCKFKGSRIDFVNIPILDKKLQKAQLSGYFDFAEFPEYKYDFFIDLDKIQVLNTSNKENEDFYGLVYADGVVAINGNNYSNNFAISAKTAGKTVFNIPIFASSDVLNQSFLRFDDKNRDTSIVKKLEDDENASKNIDINIEVTPNAIIQILLDRNSGDLIKARGDGDFHIDYNSGSDLKIYGEYVIDDGDYLFTLQNLVNKKFDIEKGSSILWNGDPYKAIVDIKAVYRTKSSLYNLLRYTDSLYDNKTRYPIECIISLKNQLLNPEIELSINVPTAQDANEILTNLSPEEISMQFMFLLVFNSFYFDPNSSVNVENSGTSSNAINVTTMELLSNQVSNWLSKINSGFDIGFNYRPGDEITTDEVELALSTQLLHDRVTVSVNGYTELGQNPAEKKDEDTKNSEIVGDVNVEVKINKKGNLRMKGFSRSNNDPLNDNYANTHGLGIFFTKEFNSISDLFRKKDKSVEKTGSSKFRRDSVEIDSVKIDAIEIDSLFEKIIKQ